MPIMVLVFVVGFILGLWIASFYSGRQASERDATLQGSLAEKAQSLQAQESRLEQLSASLRQSEEKVLDLSRQVKEQEQTIGQLRQGLNEREAQIQDLQSRAQEMEAVSAKVPAPKPEPDDLKLIEGIGPKISQVLQEANISTFGQLAETELESLEGILENAGLRLADPSTWAEQARLAAASDWKALETLQEELKGGRRI